MSCKPLFYKYLASMINDHLPDPNPIFCGGMGLLLPPQIILKNKKNPYFIPYDSDLAVNYIVY